MTLDPYRTLGLAPGASPADVKRAYRALAKANHPDSAGERALPRFLAIQAAYEQLTSGGGRGPGRARSTARPSEPWRADPARAREARARDARAGAARPGTGRAGEGPGSRARPAGTGPGTGSPGSTHGSGQRGAGGSGSAGGPGGPRPGPGPGSSGRTRAGSGTGRGSAGGSSTRRRTARKATFGSTTYDEASRPADASWSGAAWYGPSSGEYWTVNPREYADPRKHGPEYQARAAARAARAAERDAAHAEASVRTAGTTANASARAEAAARAAAAARTAAAARAEADRLERAAAARRTRNARAGRGTGDGPTARSGPEPGTGSTAGPEAFGPGGPGTPGAAGTAPWLPAGIGLEALLHRIEAMPYRRAVLALAAWPPLGIAAASVIGEATGCATFAASCTTAATFYPWVAQAVILATLLLVPVVARILAAGTAAVVVLALPVAAALTASGASYDQVHGPPLLIAVLGVAWLGGVVLGALRLRSSTRA